MTDPDELDADWIIIVPMIQLIISNDAPINGEWSVGDVTFHSKESLESRLGTRLQEPNVSKEHAEFLSRRIFMPQDKEATSFAVIERRGKPEEIRRTMFFELRQATNILAASTSFCMSRSISRGFGIHGYPSVTSKYDTFLTKTPDYFTGTWGNDGYLMPFELDENWHETATITGMIRLFERIEDTSLPVAWRRQISSGAAMLGRSLMSLELADAFLLNVIGLETLLTNRGERNGPSLARRIKGMTGWHLRHERPDYQDEIKKIHSVRCEIVHDSDYSGLTPELPLQSDLYLQNCLLNIVNLPQVFPDKPTLSAVLDGYATHENWPDDDSIPFQWVGDFDFSNDDLDLHLC
jgi:hypothetical protein